MTTTMTTLVPHRHLRLFRFFRICLVALGIKLFSLNALNIFRHERRRQLPNTPRYSIPQDATHYHALYASLLAPNLVMILMYGILATGRRVSNHTLHLALRTFFSLLLMVGLVYNPLTVIKSTINLVTELKKTNESRLRDGIEPLYEGTATERLFCTDTDTFYENKWNVGWCQIHAARNMLSLIAALLVLVELVAAYRVGEFERKKGKEGEEGGSLNPVMYALFL
ncbi:hypothetical protein BGZ93_001649 [Podila epicladia]|nr:hypothetical protein BGZ93_001649 [Podila epicladia]KAG0084464.1 hypothetical protein BGZ92_009848 [Podila epicladia]